MREREREREGRGGGGIYPAVQEQDYSISHIQYLLYLFWQLHREGFLVSDIFSKTLLLT